MHSARLNTIQHNFESSKKRWITLDYIQYGFTKQKPIKLVPINGQVATDDCHFKKVGRSERKVEKPWNK